VSMYQSKRSSKRSINSSDQGRASLPESSYQCQRSWKQITSSQLLQMLVFGGNVGAQPAQLYTELPGSGRVQVVLDIAQTLLTAHAIKVRIQAQEPDRLRAIAQCLLQRRAGGPYLP
jgi:hypothetical protein